MSAELRSDLTCRCYRLSQEKEQGSFTKARGKTMAIQLEVTLEDLSFLYTAKMKWDADFASQLLRFEAVKGEEVWNKLTNAYWLPDWTTAMIFRAYLTSVDAHFQILMDNADGIDPYVVLCDWEF